MAWADPTANLGFSLPIGEGGARRQAAERRRSSRPSLARPRSCSRGRASPRSTSSSAFCLGDRRRAARGGRPRAHARSRSRRGLAGLGVRSTARGCSVRSSRARGWRIGRGWARGSRWKCRSARPGPRARRCGWSAMRASRQEAAGRRPVRPPPGDAAVERHPVPRPAITPRPRSSSCAELRSVGMPSAGRDRWRPPSSATAPAAAPGDQEGDGGDRYGGQEYSL